MSGRVVRKSNHHECVIHKKDVSYKDIVECNECGKFWVIEHNLFGQLARRPLGWLASRKLRKKLAAEEIEPHTSYDER